MLQVENPFMLSCPALSRGLNRSWQMKGVIKFLSCSWAIKKRVSVVNSCLTAQKLNDLTTLSRPAPPCQGRDGVEIAHASLSSPLKRAGWELTYIYLNKKISTIKLLITPCILFYLLAIIFSLIFVYKLNSQKKQL